MTTFTPISALIGGILIGLATVAYLALTGRYAGISGIARAAAFGDPDRLTDILFIVGLLTAGAVYSHVAATPNISRAQLPTGMTITAVSGLLVGVGTSLGRGCTSGHGVCGLGRLSIRSLAAVCTFLVTGMLTVFIVRAITGHA